MQALPIDPILPAIVRALDEEPRLVLEAPPGAGKTTRVPRALLDAKSPWLDGEIVVLEPRRLAARMAAKRVADELGEKLGETVGYQVRFEDVSSKRTRIRFVTEGVLTRRILGDPSLAGVSAVLLDEFHERHLQGDLALALLERTTRARRADLRLCVMSATLAAAPIASYLGARTLRAEGKRFEVAIEHLPAPDDRPLASQVASAVRRLCDDGIDGDVLVFLPGAGEIRRATETCAKLAEQFDLVVLPLHGDLPPQEQDRAVRPADRRKVILSTNVAESSLTIEGVVAVIDSGLARVASHAPWSGMPRLNVAKVSRASATQRAGRAGRTRPGRCLRLYTKGDFDTRPEHDTPEIARADLAQTILELSAAGAVDLPWFEPPPPPHVASASALLARLGAIDADGAVTAAGREMARFGVHPRQARVLVEARARSVVDEACTIAALLGDRDIRLAAKTSFGGVGRGPHAAQAAHGGHAATERSDVIAMLDAFEEARDSRFAAHAMRAIGLDVGATMGVERARAQLARSVRASENSRGDENALLMCVLAGYPDRVARRVRGRSLALAGGGSAELAETSAVRDAEWMVTVDAEERGRSIVVRVASAIEPEWLIDLFPERIAERRALSWNERAERVEAREVMEYDGLALNDSPATPSDEEAARVLAEAATRAGARSFAPEGALDSWLSRARFAARALAQPEPTAADIDAALAELCEGKSSFAELRGAGLLDLLKARSPIARRLDALAPERVAIANGRTAAVSYEVGKPPWAEAYLQDFFGMSATPRVGDGKVPIVLHLLAPNKRAVQVTDDLTGFWQRHYPSIRKELMRKYPRHNWPEDPTKPGPRFARERR